jgi:hypothetical protein
LYRGHPIQLGMSTVTYRFTADDWADWAELQARQHWEKSGLDRQYRRLTAVALAAFVLGTILIVLGILTRGGTALAVGCLSFIFCLMLAAAANQCHLGKLLQMTRKQAVLTMPERMTNETEVSLTARGILEKDSCEERLTFWDAIEETQLTDKFLLVRDKNGNHLIVPVRAFGGEAAAQAFLLEIQNLRMRAAAGLGTSVVEAAASPVVQPVEPQQVQHQTAGWWRKP